MNPIETASNPTNDKTSIPRHLRYQPVRNGRKQKIRGLWERNGKFYAQMTVKDPNSGKKKVTKIPLKMDENGVPRPVATVAEAVAAQEKLKVQRAENSLPVLGQMPKFCDYVAEYLTSSVTLNKGVETIKTETVHLNAWVKHLGETRLNDITKPMITAFREKRLKEVEPSTVNGAMACLRNVLNKAVADELLQKFRLPTENIKPLTVIRPKKRLVPMDSMKKICDAASEYRNGAQFKDLILFLCYSGGRISESLRLRWQEVDWTEKHVTIGWEGDAKRNKTRVVNFNKNLESHLTDMFARRAPDSQWIFPSPQRGKKDKPARTFKETLNLAREKVVLPKFGFHDCRHFFASMCAMSDVAKDVVRDWMGHSSTKMLDDVYIHYCRDYHASQASKVGFEPIVKAA